MVRGAGCRHVQQWAGEWEASVISINNRTHRMALATLAAVDSAHAGNTLLGHPLQSLYRAQLVLKPVSNCE